MSSKSVTEALLEIRRGAEEILVEAELIERLETGKPQRVKVGFDPTAPDLHLGHTVLIQSLIHISEPTSRYAISYADFC